VHAAQDGARIPYVLQVQVPAGRDGESDEEDCTRYNAAGRVRAHVFKGRAV
jgi:hypothetical protein